MRLAVMLMLSLATSLAVCACDTDGIPAGAHCAEDADCRLVASCCDCIALPPGEDPPDCPIPECIVDECMGWFGTTQVHAVCNEGACEVHPIE